MPRKGKRLTYLLDWHSNVDACLFDAFVCRGSSSIWVVAATVLVSVRGFCTRQKGRVLAGYWPWRGETQWARRRNNPAARLQGVRTDRSSQGRGLGMDVRVAAQRRRHAPNLYDPSSSGNVIQRMQPKSQCAAEKARQANVSLSHIWFCGQQSANELVVYVIIRELVPVRRPVCLVPAMHTRSPRSRRKCRSRTRGR